MNPVFGFLNIFRDGGTVTASNDPAAAPKENAIDWRLEDYWQPPAATSHWLEIDAGVAVSADYFAFYSSDLYLQAGAKVECFAGAAPAPAALQGTINPTTRGPKYLNFTSADFRYWRLLISTTGAYSPKIQIANVGERLEMEQGYRPGSSPPAIASRNKTVTNISESGLFIGRSLEVKPVKFSLPLTILTKAWIRSNWPALLVHMERLPFFILLEPDAYPDEAVIAWTDGPIASPVYSHSVWMSLRLNLKAFT